MLQTQWSFSFWGRMKGWLCFYFHIFLFILKVSLTFCVYVICRQCFELCTFNLSSQMSLVIVIVLCTVSIYRNPILMWKHNDNKATIQSVSPVGLVRRPRSMPSTRIARNKALHNIVMSRIALRDNLNKTKIIVDCSAIITQGTH